MMSSTFATLQALVGINLGGRDDADTTAIIKAAINYAVLVAALTFEPPELKTSGNLTVTGGNDSVSLNGLTRWLDVVKIWNTTDSMPMGFIPFELWDVIVPTVVGSTRYYSIFGDTLFVKDKPGVNKVLKLFHATYPAKLVNTGDTLEFDHHDSYIVSVATGLSWAAFEEGESAGVWQKIGELVSMPFMLGARARAIIAGQKASFEALASQIGEAQ